MKSSSIFNTATSSSHKPNQLTLSSLKEEFLKLFDKELTQTEFANNATGEKQKNAAIRSHIGLAILCALENFPGVEVTCFGRQMSSYAGLKLNPAISRAQFIIVNYQNHRYLFDLGSANGQCVITEKETPYLVSDKFVSGDLVLRLENIERHYKGNIKDRMEEEINTILKTPEERHVLRRAEFVQELVNLAIKHLHNNLSEAHAPLFEHTMHPFNYAYHALLTPSDRWMTIFGEKAIFVKAQNTGYFNSWCYAFLEENKKYKLCVAKDVLLLLDEDNSIEIMAAPREQPSTRPSRLS